jgi:ribonuclease VapC
LIVLDSSAPVALLVGEPEADAIRAAMEDAPDRPMSAVNLFETRTVPHRRFGLEMVGNLAAVLRHFEVAAIPFDDDQAAVAFGAYRRYGKGSGHPAQLNLCDCAAYALATSPDLPLPSKGEDFGRTDVRGGAGA